MVALPPSDPTAAARRQRAMDRARRVVRYDSTTWYPMSMPARLGLADAFDRRWLGFVIGGKLRATATSTSARLRTRIQWRDRDPHAALAQWAGAPEELQDTDTSFAWQRLAGPNPLTITRVEREALHPRLRAVAPPGELYVQDYGILAEGEGGNSRWKERYLPTPVVLFRREGDGLQPCAILIGPRPGDPVRTPADGEGWRTARTAARVADANLSRWGCHLVWGHASLVPVAMATRRQLHPDHPLHVLLAPHLRFTAALSMLTWVVVYGPRGQLHDNSACGPDHNLRLGARFAARHPFVERDLRRSIAARGMDDPGLRYPWRDDGLAWLEVLERYARGAVEASYPSDEAVRADQELQGWLRELQDPRAGNLGTVTPSGHLDDRDGLVALLGQILFLAGPGHDSLHNAELQSHHHPALAPMAAWADPARCELADELLPPPSRGIANLDLAVNGLWQYDRFGDVDAYPVASSPVLAPALARLRRDLAELERTLTARNRTRPWAYAHMLPPRVSNGVVF